MKLTDEKLEKQAPYFYPADFDITSWKAISESFDELESKQYTTPRDLLTMLYQANELFSMVYQAYNVAFFKTLADTNDTVAQQNLNIMLNEIMLPLEKRFTGLLTLYMEHPQRQLLSQENYRKLNESFATYISNSNRQNSGLTLKLNQLMQEYRQTLNGIMVTIDGESVPINIVSQMLSKAEPDRREVIWMARKDAFLQHKEKLHSILDRMIKSMHRLATEAGYSNYYEQALTSSFLGKLNPEKVADIHKAVKKAVLPVVREFIDQRRKRLSMKSIRPWDLEADPEASALKPFTSTDELVGKAISVLYNIRFEYGILMNKMQNTGFLNLDYSPDKVKGEFNGAMPQCEAGFIHMCSTGHHRDMVMLFHEMGHVLQSVSLFRNPLGMFYELPVQVRELASQSLVYLSTSGWDTFYPDREDQKTAFRSLFEYDLMQVLHWTILNRFEQMIHTNPDWTPAEREAEMGKLWNECDLGVDWRGLEDWQNILWMQELSLFEFPHYLFMSSLSIFNVWQIYHNYRNNPNDTVSRFQRFLQKTPELSDEAMFNELNIRQDYSERHMQKMIDYIKSEYKRFGK
jgi:oligoendopeptidase F